METRLLTHLWPGTDPAAAIAAAAAGYEGEVGVAEPGDLPQGEAVTLLR